MSDLPSGWEWSDLSQICTSITDGDHQPPPQTSSGIPFLVIGNMRNQRLDFSGCRYVPEEYYNSLKSIRRPQKGDVLYSLVGSYGIPALVRDADQFCVQRHIGILRPSSMVSAPFLAYLLSSRDVYDQATSCATGTAQLTVPLTGLRRIRVPIPPRDVQDSIVAAIELQFSRLDAGVGSLGRVRANIDRLRTAILASALSGNLTKPASARTTRRLADVVTIASGQTPSGLQLADHGPVPFYKVGDMNSATGSFMGASRGYVDEATVKKFGLHVRPAGTVIFPKRGGAIATNKKRILQVPAAYDLNTMGLIPGEMISSRFLYLWLSSIELSRLADGSNVPQINNGDLQDLTLNLPSRSEQDKIVAAADILLADINLLAEALDRSEVRSDRLRSAVLAAAFSGKLVPH